MLYQSRINENAPDAPLYGDHGQNLDARIKSSGFRRFAAWTVGVLLTIILIQLCAGLIAGTLTLIKTSSISINHLIFGFGWFAGGGVSASIACAAAKKIAPEVELDIVVFVVLFLLAVLNALGGSTMGTIYMVIWGAVGMARATR
jgi:hypothetical protein